MAAKIERGALRDALLDEVKSVCEADGPEAVSFGRISRGLGVSSGAPFRLFASRAEIFGALIIREMSRLDAEMKAQAVDNPEVQMRGLCETYLNYAAGNPAMFRLSFSVSATTMKDRDLEALGRRIYGRVRAAVAACMPQASAETAETVAYLSWTRLHGHALLKMSGQLDDVDVSVSDKRVIDATLEEITRSA
ncbi:TetR/AcrR family transcriptional regulator [Litoreibacter roseus]|uniref:HTH tetR-type domain-containing protein n=1 Tax=Litoreibacter roseus TaxID=2601869 RepID=A0A6N6JNA2_9RHOB|nr:TetR/AcrR family transcriptional regulator [Litoreibacter roseus]GFE67009.1 hypothetical protein KIN_40830 [Litoreibacter roseus]